MAQKDTTYYWILPADAGHLLSRNLNDVSFPFFANKLPHYEMVDDGEGGTTPVLQPNAKLIDRLRFNFRVAGDKMYGTEATADNVVNSSWKVIATGQLVRLIPITKFMNERLLEMFGEAKAIKDAYEGAFGAVQSPILEFATIKEVGQFLEQNTEGI